MGQREEDLNEQEDSSSRIDISVDSDALEDSEEARWEAQAALEQAEREVAREKVGDGEDSVDWDKELANARAAASSSFGSPSPSNVSTTIPEDSTLSPAAAAAVGTSGSEGDVSSSERMQLAAAVLAKVEAEAVATEAREDVATLEAELVSVKQGIAEQVAAAEAVNQLERLRQ
jgi:hypothetical protein